MPLLKLKKLNCKTIPPLLPITIGIEGEIKRPYSLKGKACGKSIDVP
jgi:hypothetical protein